MINNILKYSLLISLSFIMNCTYKAQILLPSQADSELTEELKNASDEHASGWKDGCEAGISGGSNTFYKMFYRNNKIDGYRMASSPEYRDTWDSAFWYCFRFTYIRQKSSIWSSIMKGFR